MPEWLLDALVEHAREAERVSASHAVIVWAILAAKYANRDGATPACSHARLARDAGLSVSTVRRALAALAAVGALRSAGTGDGEHQGANRYRLSWDGAPCSPGDNGVSPTEQGGAPTGTDPCSPGDNVSREVLQMMPVVDTGTDEEGVGGEVATALRCRADTARAVVDELVEDGFTLATIRAHLQTATPAERGKPWDFARRVRQGAHQLSLVGTDGKATPLLELQMRRIAEADEQARASAAPMPAVLRVRVEG